MKTRNQHYPSSGNKQQGYSLVELMVASVIGLIILSGAITVFTGNKSSQEFSSGMARLQESGRVALDILSNDIRLAGFQGCTDGTIEPNILAKASPDIKLPSGALWGGEFGGGSSWSPTIHGDLTSVSTQPKSGTDVIYVQHGSGRTTILASSMTTTNSPITLSLNPDQLAADDLIIISDCSNADIFRATSVDAATGSNVTVGFAAGAANDSATLSSMYTISGSTADRVSDAMRVMRYEANAYFVADSGRDNTAGDDIYSLFVLDTTPSTTPGALELVEGVENMQILYGQKLLNGSVQYLKAGNPSLNIDNVVSVQIGLLMATTDSVNSTNDNRTYLIANEKIGPPSSSETIKHEGGKVMRASFNTTIQLRNRSANL